VKYSNFNSKDNKKLQLQSHLSYF